MYSSNQKIGPKTRRPEDCPQDSSWRRGFWTLEWPWTWSLVNGGIGAYIYFPPHRMTYDRSVGPERLSPTSVHHYTEGHENLLVKLTFCGVSKTSIQCRSPCFLGFTLKFPARAWDQWETSRAHGLSTEYRGVYSSLPNRSHRRSIQTYARLRFVVWR